MKLFLNTGKNLLTMCKGLARQVRETYWNSEGGLQTQFYNFVLYA